MCIAILSPKGTELTKEHLENCWENNFNGAGFMYNDNNNVLHVIKEMTKFSRFYKNYVKIKKRFPNCSMLVHFRISTHGVITKENCHPFKINSNLGFIHNGMIPNVTKDKVFSDTNMFNREILKKLPNMGIELFDNKAMKTLIHEYIGYSKLVFMDNVGQFAIINEEAGHWNEGIWYSNKSYETVAKTIDYGGKTVSKSSYGSGWTNGSGWNNAQKRIGFDYGQDNYKPWDDVVDKRLDAKKETVGYKIDDGTGTCSSCGVYLWEGELLNHCGDCLECVSVGDVTDICAMAVADGAIITETRGTYITSKKEVDIFDNEATKDEIATCDYCSTVKAEHEITHFPEWDGNLCKGCIDMMVQQGYMDQSQIPDDEVDTEAEEIKEYEEKWEMDRKTGEWETTLVEKKSKSA